MSSSADCLSRGPAIAPACMTAAGGGGLDPRSTSPLTARETIQRHSRSFSFASRLLPAAARDDVEKLYAWCRWCDDGVDAAPSPEAAAAFVEMAADDLRCIAAGGVPSAVESRWLASLVRRHDIPIGAAKALLEGIRSDLLPAVDLGVDDLLRYCFRVAGAVGVMMCPMLGLRERRFLPHAAALGIGMQLTNIARDVAEDWDRSRCYLPLEWTGGLRPGGGPPDREQVRRGVRTILDMADRYYAAGEAGIAALNPRCRLAVLVASRVYHAIGTTIRKRGLCVLDARARVSGLTKARLFGRAVLGLSAPGTSTTLDDASVDAVDTASNLLRDHGVLT